MDWFVPLLPHQPTIHHSPLLYLSSNLIYYFTTLYSSFLLPLLLIHLKTEPIVMFVNAMDTLIYVIVNVIRIRYYDKNKTKIESLAILIILIASANGNASYYRFSSLLWMEWDGLTTTNSSL